MVKNKRSFFVAILAFVSLNTLMSYRLIRTDILFGAVRQEEEWQTG